MSEEFRVVRGVPTDEELAAIVGVLMLRTHAPADDAGAESSRWAASTRPTRGRLSRTGPGAWRASALPR
jgi:hypothetical protein